MKILIVSNPQHQLIINQIKWLKRFNNEITFDIFDSTCSGYENNSVFFDNIFSIKANKILLFLFKGYYRVYIYKRQMKLIKYKYDIVHIHMSRLQYLSILNSLLLKGRLIVSIWGSDFYKNSQKNNLKLKRLYEKSFKIVFSNEQTCKDFNSFYNFNENKFIIIKLGLDPIDQLYNIKDLSKIECKSLMGFPIDKIAITIGYNFNENQQHIDIIKAINLSDKLVKYQSRIFFIFPLTYGKKNKQYVESLYREISEMQYEHKIIDKFITDENIAKLRKSTDIFIQLQKTDQLSGSTQESLYAKNIVITGAWLPYKILIDIGCYFKVVDNVSRIADVLYTVLENFEEENKRCIVNDRNIYSLSSWAERVKEWNEMYLKIANV